MLCLRIHRGIPVHGDDEAWVREKAIQAARFLGTELAAHFKAEEEVLFPAMKEFAGASQLLVNLIDEHRQLQRISDRFHASGLTAVAGALTEFADLLEAHIRREERELFPLYESQVARDEALQIEIAVKAMIGNAAQPKTRPFLNEELSGAVVLCQTIKMANA